MGLNFSCSGFGFGRSSMITSHKKWMNHAAIMKHWMIYIVIVTWVLPKVATADVGEDRLYLKKNKDIDWEKESKGDKGSTGAMQTKAKKKIPDGVGKKDDSLPARTSRRRRTSKPKPQRTEPPKKVHNRGVPEPITTPVHLRGRTKGRNESDNTGKKPKGNQRDPAKVNESRHGAMSAATTMKRRNKDDSSKNATDRKGEDPIRVPSRHETARKNPVRKHKNAAAAPTKIANRDKQDPKGSSTIAAPAKDKPTRKRAENKHREPTKGNGQLPLTMTTTTVPTKEPTERKKDSGHREPTKGKGQLPLTMTTTTVPTKQPTKRKKDSGAGKMFAKKGTGGHGDTKKKQPAQVSQRTETMHGKGKIETPTEASSSTIHIGYTEKDNRDWSTVGNPTVHESSNSTQSDDRLNSNFDKTSSPPQQTASTAKPLKSASIDDNELRSELMNTSESSAPLINEASNTLTVPKPPTNLSTDPTVVLRSPTREPGLRPLVKDDIIQSGKSSSSGLSHGEVSVIACGSAAVLILLVASFLYRFQKTKNEKNNPSTVATLSSTGSPASTSGATSGSTTRGDQSIPTIDYDYLHEYQTDAQSLSVAGGTKGSRSCATEINLAAIPESSGTIFSEDQALDRAYDEMREEMIDVSAPPGRLGIVIGTPDEDAPVVLGIKDSSPIADKVRVGDKLVAVDKADVRTMAAGDISHMISQNGSGAPKRTLTIIRRMPYDKGWGY